MSDSSPGENVFLVSTDVETFERTVASPVEPGDLADPPSALAGDGAVRLWAVPEGTRNEESFGRMAPGDLLLFYADGTYVGVGRVGGTFEDAEGWAGEALPDAANVVAVSDFVPLSIGRAAVNALFDYAPSYVPQGLMRVAPERLTARPSSIEVAVRRYDEQRD